MRSEEDPKLAKLIPFDMLMKATGNMYPCPFMAAVLSPMLADNCIACAAIDRAGEKNGVSESR